MTGGEVGQRPSTAAALALWSNVICSQSLVSEARYEISVGLQLAGYQRALIDDINLIVTELTVNALTHGGASEVEIDIARTLGDAAVVVTVVHDENVERFRVDDPPVMAGEHEVAGRGRAIVAALSDAFTTTRRPPWRIEHVATIYI